MAALDKYATRILNAILFFVENTKRPSKTKIFKLLYFLDFIHTNETGKGVTSLDYFAWPKGPIPMEIYKPMQDGKLPEYLVGKVVLRKLTSGKCEYFGGLIESDLSVFTPRQIRLMQELAKKFSDADAEEISLASHYEGAPWHTTYHKKGARKLIDYGLAASARTPLESADITRLHREEQNFREKFMAVR